MRRRTVLGFAGGTLSGALTGCIGSGEQSISHTNTAPAGGAPPPAAALGLDEVGDRSIGLTFTRSLERYGTTAQVVVTRAIEDGSVLVETETPPFYETIPLSSDGRIFEIEKEAGQTRPATRYFWDLDPVEEAPDSDTVRFEELPEIDRSKFWLQGLADGSRGERNSDHIGGTFKYANADRDDSVLIPTPDKSIIAWSGDRHSQFTIRDSNSDGATVTEYRYTATLLAESFSSYGEQLRERYAFEFTDLSESERELVEQAITSGYEIDAGRRSRTRFGR